MAEHLAAASSQCPLCGNDTPHGHDERDIIAWLDAQLSRFGVKAVYRRRKANDEISVLGDLRQRAETYYKSQGYDDDDIELAIVEIETLERQITSLTAQLAKSREALASAIRIAGEAADEWDRAPEGMRAGKILIALAGRVPGYRKDIDEIHRALSPGERK